MPVQRNGLLLIAAVATLSTLPVGSAGAQKYYSRDGRQNFLISKPPPSVPKPPTMPKPGHGGWHPGGWRGPGIIVAVPPRGVIVDEGPGEYVPYRPRRSRQRNARCSSC